MPAPAGSTVVVDVQHELGDRAAVGKRHGERTAELRVAGIGLLPVLVVDSPLLFSEEGEELLEARECLDFGVHPGHVRAMSAAEYALLTKGWATEIKDEPLTRSSVR